VEVVGRSLFYLLVAALLSLIVLFLVLSIVLQAVR